MSTIYDSDIAEQVRADAFKSGKVPVAVYGLGKMGLPLAAVYADICSNVIGVDVDPDIVTAIGAGNCPVSGEPGLSELVEQTVEEDALRATTDIDAAASEERFTSQSSRHCLMMTEIQISLSSNRYWRTSGHSSISATSCS